MTKPLRTVAAYESTLTALRELATSRSHDMRAPLRDDRLSAAMQCTKCERWVVFTIPEHSGADPAELRGDALGACPGTPHKPVAADGGRVSNYLAEAVA